MLRLALTVATAIALASPGLAAELSLTIQNDSSHVITRLNTFAVDETGTPVEDNLGALMEDVAAGTSAKLNLSILACQKVYVALGLDGSDDDVTTTVDTCKNGTLILTD